MGCNFSDTPSRELIPRWLTLLSFKNPCSSDDLQGLSTSKGLVRELFLAKESSVSASLTTELSLWDDFTAQPLGESKRPQMSKLVKESLSVEVEEGVLFGGLMCRERSGATGIVSEKFSPKLPRLNISSFVASASTGRQAIRYSSGGASEKE